MFLYGASGHAKVIIDILKSNNILIDGIFDDNLDIVKLLEYRVLGTYNPQVVRDKKILISIGDNRIRANISERIFNEFGMAIHVNASISDNCIIGTGTVVMHKVIVQSDATIGQHCIINTAAVVEHDCKIGDFVHISPNSTICGNVKIGEGTHIGAGAIVIPGIIIGKWCTVGAGSVIIKDIPDYSVVVGNPGCIIKTIK